MNKLLANGYLTKLFVISIIICEIQFLLTVQIFLVALIKVLLAVLIVQSLSVFDLQVEEALSLWSEWHS